MTPGKKGRKAGVPGSAVRRGSSDELSVDLAKLPAPSRVIVANHCAVFDSGLFVQLVFSVREGHDEGRTVARVLIPINVLLAHLWASSGTFFEETLSAMTAMGLEVEHVSELRGTGGASDIPIVGANIFRLAQAGVVESSLECYFISAHTVHLAKTAGARLAITPVLGIYLPTTVLMGILDYARSHKGDFQRRLGRPAEPEGSNA